MSFQRFQLVFIGAACGEEQLDNFKISLAKRFQLEKTKVDYLLSKKSVVIKKNLDAETAITYKRVIDRLGGIVRIEAMPLTPDSVKETWFVDRRETRRRYSKERRKSARVWMYRSNRRCSNGRRVND